MRSTWIRLSAVAALAALASPRRRKTLFVLAVAGLLGIVAGCSGGGGAAKNDSLEPSQDVFARAGGWIAFQEGKEIVAVVNQDFVSRYLPNEDPIGKRFKYFGMDSMNDPFMTIVGVVGNVRHRSLVTQSAPEVYVSYLRRKTESAGEPRLLHTVRGVGYVLREE